MQTRRELITLGGAALMGGATALIASPTPVLAATPLDYQVNIADPSFGPVDTIANTTATFQKGLDYCFGPVTAPHGTARVTSNKEAHVPPGLWRTNAPLQVKYLHGGRILGAGRFVTKIENVTPGSDVFRTNGCGYAYFAGLYLRTVGLGGKTLNAQGNPVYGGRCIDLNWDGSPGGPALQSNTFTDMFFDGGDYGVEIGRGGHMGAENLFLNCFWIRQGYTGLRTSNWNALQQTILGGNFQQCRTAIMVRMGSVPVIHGVGFQGSTVCDIDIQNTAKDSYSIAGCRSESANFVTCPNYPAALDISGCSHLSNTNGYFLNAASHATIRSCQSHRGRIRSSKRVYHRIEGVQFGREYADALEQFQLYPDAAVEIHTSHFGATFIPARRITAAGAFDYQLAPVTP